ncbi:MAG: hypothetical protein GF353_07145 [Candidatus Lokiarchaeota archaeon]|nr:hypothetical protein [Candidatus Lokiarchaeota archaeon]
MLKLYTNTSKRKDFLRSVLERYGKNTDVDIAVAFFTNANYIKYLVKNKCKVRLIVRLGFPTSARDLSEIISIPNVSIRYFTSVHFHPKLYIFGNSVAVLGSSNLTDSGIQTNQELNILIESEDPIFDELKIIFAEYWAAARPLTKIMLRDYNIIVSALGDSIKKSEKNIQDRLGHVEFKNITRPDTDNKPSEEIIYDEFLKKYEMFLKKFDELKQIYESLNVRKVNESELPIRIEIDQFLNWIRQKKAQGQKYLQAPIRQNVELKNFLIANIKEFINDDFDDIYDVMKDRYPIIKKFLLSKSIIDSLSKDQIKSIVLIIHAFEARARYYGGKEEILNTFTKENSIDKIKNTFKYLLFGHGEFEYRIAHCIYSDKYKLNHFGKSCVEELYGWANNKKVPICNERTFKSMQWLGFGNMQ